MKMANTAQQDAITKAGNILLISSAAIFLKYPAI
jgi:hypothetical protein